MCRKAVIQGFMLSTSCSAQEIKAWQLYCRKRDWCTRVLLFSRLFMFPRAQFNCFVICVWCRELNTTDLRPVLTATVKLWLFQALLFYLSCGSGNGGPQFRCQVLALMKHIWVSLMGRFESIQAVDTWLRLQNWITAQLWHICLLLQVKNSTAGS